MDKLTSKLQYKTCEKGEYYEEQLRNLQETVALIQGYPWYREQYAEIDLTGPSITIEDNQGNFLKVGIYYGGRLTLYYLFKNVLYTRFNLGYEEVIPAVEDFFANKLGLAGFEKTLYNIGKKSYFTTRQFVYQITPAKILARMYFLIIYTALQLTFPILAIASSSKIIDSVFSLIPLLVLSFILYRCFFAIYNKKEQSLKISRGNNTFIFCDENGTCKTLDKADITGLTKYISNNHKNPVEVEFYEFLFNDGSTILFSNALISGHELQEKFASYWKLRSTTRETSIFQMLWNR